MQARKLTADTNLRDFLLKKWKEIYLIKNHKGEENFKLFSLFYGFYLVYFQIVTLKLPKVFISQIASILAV